MRIEFSPPDINEEDIQAVVDALRSGWITTGPRTKLFEQELAKWCNTPRVACLNSATAALECALRLLDIGPGDEVITSAYTYTASASVICHVGATPVLVDTAPGSYEMDYDKLALAITPRTKVVIPVDIAGDMGDYDRLETVLDAAASRYQPKAGSLQEAFGRIVVLADAAHSFGALYKGRPCGSVADFSAFSFHAVKNLTTSEGGALTWKPREGLDDEYLYKQLMLLSLHGQNKDALAKTKAGSWEYDIVAPLYKCNMTDVVAALGLSQLKRYKDMLARRRVVLESYARGLAHLNVEVLCKPLFDEASGQATVSSSHLCMVRLTGATEAFRNSFIEGMAQREVACNVHFKPLPLHTAYKNLGFDIADFPQALAQHQNQVTLPLHTKLTDEEVAYIIEAFEATYRECASLDV
ncbi:MAG: DegT/DnrJ/EryC1/StrS family aminotransferase [Coriobacteriales bacterium]|jgi:dTDP-4-amino-4,6-dideoxygalactose transaminase|nr:DegT/DnrJ/EryC1/StrS family aminotransferase [Coriobacteriales bacterium]